MNHRVKTAVSIVLWLALLLMSPVTFSGQAPIFVPAEKVTLQLKWLHQFQFAGFYAAKEQGYYAQEGLDVDILERSPDKDKDIVKQVTSGEVDFAIGDSGISSYYARGEPIVALAAIFQHNPLVFIAKQSTGIISCYEMQGKKVMFDSVGAGDAPLRAILLQAETNYTLIKQSFNADDLINDKVDVISAYLSNEPFYFQEKSVKINIINPQSYGIDFYGDVLFTSQQQVNNHPERVEKFRRASLKGWQYALDHPEQLIQLIHQKYHSKLSLAHLRFEADITRKLILADRIPLGQLEPRRLKQVADVYAQLKFSRPLTENDLAKFIYSSRTLNLSAQEQAWLKAHPVIRLGIDKDFAPYEWIDDEGHYQGLIADYVVRFEQLLGVKFDIIKDKSWADILNMAKNEQLDMIAAAVQTPERDSYLNFTFAYTDSPVIIINDTALRFIGSLSKLQGKRVVVEKGYFMTDVLKRDYPAIQLVLAENIQDALYQVANGKADAYVGDAVSANYAISQLGLWNLRFSGNTGYSSSHSVAVIKKHPELLSIMKKVIATIPISEREQINNRWLSLNVSNGIRLKTVVQYTLGVLFIMLFFVAWNIRLRREVIRREKIEQQLRTLTVAIEQSPASVVITDLDGVLQYVNPRFTEVTGYSAKEALGKNPRILKSGLNSKETYDQLWSTLIKGEVWHGELINCRKNGDVYWEEVHIAPVKDSAGVKTHYVGIKLDITERKAAEEKIKQLAFFDPLTGLPNRRKLFDRLQYAIALNHRANTQFAVFMMDLDKFKAVNDKLGHAAGDVLLKQVAVRITHCLRDSDMVARLGGDEFILVLENMNIPEDAEIIALKIIEALTAPFQLSEHDSVQIGASIGISIYPQHGVTPEILMDHADTALYQAKDNGRGCFAYFAQANNEDSA
jgi:diguanylate cyclase (GGDEF)-like protein/PAS domain S-box-containing protein